MQTKKGRALKRQARILIVDDHPMMRAGLVAQISDEPDLEVCGQAEDVTQALAAVKATSPDLAIIDMALKAGHGIDLIKDIKSRFPEVKMLVLSAYQESLYAERALRAGAMGYLNKQETGQKIFEAIRTVLAGGRYLSEELTQRLVGLAIGAVETTTTSPFDRLSARELEIFRLIGHGWTSGAIANSLCLSTHTIDTHRENIKRKVGARNAAELNRQAVQWVLENG